MIRGYPRSQSVRPGEALTLHVSTDHPRFRVEFYRHGATLEHLGDLGVGVLDGVPCHEGPTDRDWGWPGYEFKIPSDWKSGAYVAMLTSIDSSGRERRPDAATVDGTDAKTLFVVRSGSPGSTTSILYKVSTNTFHAYNSTGYGSLYAEAVWVADPPFPGYKVTFRRPGGSTGGIVEPGIIPHYYDREARRQTFSYWDAPFIAWLESSGYVLEYCTDSDLHRGVSLLAPYNLLLSVGHDEYWSAEMREHTEQFLRGGGNVAFFSGNICGYRVHFVDGDTAMTCAKVKPSTWDAPGWGWDDWGLEQNALLGVSDGDGGGWWDGTKRRSQGYTVQHAGHWVFAGTGLKEGDCFGVDSDFPLVGYEVMGAPYVRRNGMAVATTARGTPRSFFILGIAELGPGWSNPAHGAAATMGVYTASAGGTVFQAAVTDWPKVAPKDSKVGQITRNVIDKLRLRSARVVGPLPARSGRLLAVEGETSHFHVDREGAASSTESYQWTAAGAELAATAGPTAALRTPSPIQPVTVSVTVREGSSDVAFGSVTFWPLSKQQALQFETLSLLNEINNQNGPGFPLVGPTVDPVGQMGSLFPARLPRVARVTERLAEVAKELRKAGPKEGREP